MIDIIKGQKWMCIAPGQPKRTHTVISNLNGRVITWSDPSPSESEGGESFLGSPYEFKSMFALSNCGGLPLR